MQNIQFYWIHVCNFCFNTTLNLFCLKLSVLVSIEPIIFNVISVWLGIEPITRGKNNYIEKHIA